MPPRKPGDSSADLHELFQRGYRSGNRGARWRTWRQKRPLCREDKAFEKNMEKLLEKLENQPNRSARFRTIISLILDGQEYFFEGICNGQILLEGRGGKGFGYDPIFLPDGDHQSFAEMTMEEKNQYSHRKIAADKLLAFLDNYFSSKP